MSFRVSYKVFLGFHLLYVFLGLVYGYFRVHLGFHVVFLIRISYQDFFGFHLGSL